jgi:hypothetical protein
VRSAWRIAFRPLDRHEKQEIDRKMESRPTICNDDDDGDDGGVKSKEVEGAAEPFKPDFRCSRP